MSYFDNPVRKFIYGNGLVLRRKLSNFCRNFRQDMDPGDWYVAKNTMITLFLTLCLIPTVSEIARPYFKEEQELLREKIELLEAEVLKNHADYDGDGKVSPEERDTFLTAMYESCGAKVLRCGRDLYPSINGVGGEAPLETRVKWLQDFHQAKSTTPTQ